jgi:hypothetical protein
VSAGLAKAREKAMNEADISELTPAELDQVTGGAVLEIGIGPITIQINPDSGCWALWYGKSYVGGACKK